MMCFAQWNWTLGFWAAADDAIGLGADPATIVGFRAKPYLMRFPRRFPGFSGIFVYFHIKSLGRRARCSGRRQWYDAHPSVPPPDPAGYRVPTVTEQIREGLLCYGALQTFVNMDNATKLASVWWGSCRWKGMFLLGWAGFKTNNYATGLWYWFASRGACCVLCGTLHVPLPYGLWMVSLLIGSSIMVMGWLESETEK